MLSQLDRLSVRPQSVISVDGIELGLTGEDDGLRLAVVAPDNSSNLNDFDGERHALGGGRSLLLGPRSSRNAAALRNRFAWLCPRTLGLKTSAGLGDRLGLATPGHVRALRATGGDLAPIFAQQSIREMERTGRNPQEVIDDATWGIFEEGWRETFGADADHLKTPQDIDRCVAAGYTFFTFDPGEHVDDSAETADSNELRRKIGELPWHEFEDSPEDLKGRYLRELDFEGYKVTFDEGTLYRAAVKYGRAVAHASALFRHLAESLEDRNFEVEVSVDETETPTTHAQHVYIVGELRRLGVRWVSLAPRYVGRFEKGVDYIGDVEELEADLAVHAAIARSYGPYKLSLHSGSDKFSIYDAMMRQTQGLVHLKTAGTSYLEALRTVAKLDPTLFREIYAFARDRYGDERASYHVSADLGRAPAAPQVSDDALPDLLEQFDARQILHVTFGAVLQTHTEEGVTQFRERLISVLETNADAYAGGLEAHFVRHLKPFSGRVPSDRR